MYRESATASTSPIGLDVNRGEPTDGDVGRSRSGKRANAGYIELERNCR